MSIPFQIGKLRNRVIIQTPTITFDDAGGQIKTFGTFATVWAEILPLNGREFFQAQAFNSEVTGRIIIRDLAGIKPQMRVKFGSRIYDIHSIIQIQQRPIRIELLVREALDN